MSQRQANARFASRFRYSVSPYISPLRQPAPADRQVFSALTRLRQTVKRAPAPAAIIAAQPAPATKACAPLRSDLLASVKLDETHHLDTKHGAPAGKGAPRDCTAVREAAGSTSAALAESSAASKLRELAEHVGKEQTAHARPKSGGLETKTSSLATSQLASKDGGMVTPAKGDGGKVAPAKGDRGKVA
jgi:hypothetical protein